LIGGTGRLSESDIDTLVDFLPEARIRLFRFASLAEDVEKLLGRKIDLVTKQGLKPWGRYKA
jgi:predicted nucleotidyltransferase